MLIPYPPTRHLEGSLGVHAGPDRVPFATIRGRNVVVEEKIDGDIVGVRFDADARLRLSNHGADIDPGDRRFRRAWAWAAQREDALFDQLGDRYAVFHECMAWKHTVFYDALPDVMIEYDVLDMGVPGGAWLSTPRRAALLAGVEPAITPVRVLHQGPLDSYDQLRALLDVSVYKTGSWKVAMGEDIARAGIPAAETWAGTDGGDFPEGLYIKVEEDGRVVERYKWILTDFLGAIRSSEAHWRSRPPLPNRILPAIVPALQGE